MAFMLLRFFNFLPFIFLAGSVIAQDKTIIRSSEPVNINLVDLLLSKGDSLNKADEYDLAVGIFNHAIRQSALLGYDKGMIKGYIGKAEVYERKGDNLKSVPVLEEALRVCDLQDSNKKYKAAIYNMQGENYAYRGMYKESAECFERAVSSAEAYPDT